MREFECDLLWIITFEIQLGQHPMDNQVHSARGEALGAGEAVHSSECDCRMKDPAGL